MTIETWKAEFYPTPVEECTTENALEHSLQKWKGLTEENKKHQVWLCAPGYAGITEGRNWFYLSVETCSLCHVYGKSNGTKNLDCSKCPLSVSRGGVPCDKASDWKEESPWESFAHHNRPDPMIKALEEARDSLKEPQQITSGEISIR